MWQRKQTIYLLLAVILSVVTLSSHFYSWLLFAVLLVAASDNLLTVFLFHNRPLQQALCLSSIFVYLLWYVLLIIFSKQTAPDANDFRLPWSAVLPAFSLVLTFMARNAIIADEKLVRDSNRLR